MNSHHSAIQFPLNCWFVATASSSLHDGPYGITICGTPLVLFRDSLGHVVAFEDRCVHRAAPLSLGRVEPAGLRCLYHGLLFNSEGVCTEVPGQKSVPRAARVKTFPVAETSGWVWVWPGDPTLADFALIPPATTGRDNQWVTSQSYLDFDAHYLLLVDNLLDFSHVAYVHERSFKADTKWATVRPTIEAIPRGVRVSRWIVDTLALSSARDWAGKPSDTWQSYDFLAPGILIMETCYCLPGSAKLAAFGVPREGVMARNRACQAVTPMTSKASRYFFAVVLPASEVSPEDCENVLAVSRSAFLEDKAMIEAQQARIAEDHAWKPLAMPGDRALWDFHKILEQLGDQSQRTTDAALTSQ